ncbi:MULTISPECIES: NEL-type E3 ubiquitin ligase domain-containing protein [unclassified Pseudomonas]|uniref:NEL-type E3 ubiquitin ligase domain-containing protein n=1 Tax=unclassified Pseudomonas TaxID=196821 RepID=UPI0035BFE06B
MLNLAGLFLPGIGLTLLALNAWQLLGEVYHGIEAWHEGDTSDALNHLFNVAGDLAQVAATAVGGQVLLNAWRRARRVDELVAATLEDGSTRLWNQDLSAYRSEAPAAAVRDEQGVLRLGELAWVSMDGHTYPVTKAPEGGWRLRTQAGLAPRLRHNGAGAWRLWSEQPQEWDDVQRMFRRLGYPFDQLDEQQVSRVLLGQGLDATHLRALHVHGLAADAQLFDNVARYRIDQRIRDLMWDLGGGGEVNDGELLEHARTLLGLDATAPVSIVQVRAQRAALFQRVYEAEQGEDEASVATLRRQFPSLHSRAARELLRQARGDERQRLQLEGRVSLRLAQAARQVTRRIRLSRACDGLYLHAPQDADLARVAIGLSPGLYGAPATLGWRLFEGSTQGPLLHTAGVQGGPGCFDLVHQNGQFLLLDAQGLQVSGPGELFETLAAAYGPEQRRAMLGLEPFGDDLRALLGERAASQGEALAQWLQEPPAIGWFRPPQRLLDGRLGYPLSGRRAGNGMPRAMLARLRDLYPSFDDAQVEAWLQGIRDAGRESGAELQRLEGEYLRLHRHLLAWSEAPDTLMERLDRRDFAEALCSSWQRRTSHLHNQMREPVGYRLSVWATTLPSLPDLPEQVSFAHVRELSLLNMGIEQIPASFLQRFTAVEVLELSHNRLTRLPAGLAELPALRELDLFANDIALDADQAEQLSGCVALEFINLSLNPLRRTFALERMSSLSRIHLRGTQIDQLPSGLLGLQRLTVADLRGNRLHELPEAFYQAPADVSRRILLQGNPFAPRTAARYSGFRELHGLPTPVEVEASLAPRERWLDAAAIDARAQYGSYWNGLEAEDGSVDFFNLLSRLLETSDYQNLAHRPGLATRVFTLMQAMCEHAGLREAVFSDAQVALTCQDSATLRLSNLELRALVWRARVQAGEGGQEAALLHLGRQLWRLDEVDRIALEDIQARREDGADPDQIEVGLAYRLALRDELDLPAQPQDMAFAEVAGLDQGRIDRALAQVRTAQTPERVALSLAQRDFWQEHLLNQHAERFEALDAAFFERQQALMDAPEALPEGAYLEAMNRIGDERQAARLALMRTLTRQALEGTPQA